MSGNPKGTKETTNTITNPDHTNIISYYYAIILQRLFTDSAPATIKASLSNTCETAGRLATRQKEEKPFRTKIL